MLEAVSLHILTKNKLQLLFQLSAHVYIVIFSTLQWIGVSSEGVAFEDSR